MTDSEKVDKYIKNHSKWTATLTALRKIFKETELDEAVKWGSPTYVYNGKLVAGIAAFKNHCAIWFHQGVFLKDEAKVLVNAQEGKTKALRQWRIEATSNIETELIKQYVYEAIENCKQGKEVKIQRNNKVTIPNELSTAFKENTKLEKAFKSLTPGKQREYANHIAEAKRDATKLSRLKKITPMILNGIGLYDKYKNC